MSIIMEEVKEKSLKRLQQIKAELENAFGSENEIYEGICVYACGSLGRLEMADNSDLDLFFIETSDSKNNLIKSKLNKYLFFANLHNVTQKLDYPDPSKQGEYWEFIDKKSLLDIGSREEDYNNSFTSRLLLILESKPLYNEEVYEKLLRETIKKYFVDYEEHKKGFYPLFLMNDIHRYWYTLTQNYEYRRDVNDDDNKKNWKRLKLKYARLLTCFSMMACLYKKDINIDYVIQCIRMTPFERLDMLSTRNEKICGIVEDIKKEYEWFLDLRINQENWISQKGNKKVALNHADKFHKLFIQGLMKEISNEHPELKNKMDIY